MASAHKRLGKKGRQSRCAILGGIPVRKRPFRSHPVLDGAERKEVLSVLKSGVLSGYIASAGASFGGGPKAQKLEELSSRYFGTRYSVAMNSATSCLHAALYAAGVGPGDEVLVSPYTMSASASAIVMCGGVPVFVDVDPETFCMDPALLEAKITPRTKAIVVVHLFGHPACMTTIMKIAKKHQLKVIEDCAQAPAAVYRGKKTGTFGDIGIISLNQHKTVTCGEGGIAITSSKELALKMQLIRNHGEVVLDKIPEARSYHCLGWNYRMTELVAAVAIPQFKKLEFLTKYRIGLAEYLTRRLSVLRGLGLPRAHPGCRHVYFVYPIRFDERAVGISRDLFVKALAAEGVPFGPGYVRPIYLEPMYQRRRIFDRSQFPFDVHKGSARGNYRKGSCPRTEFFHERGLMITSLCRYPLTRRDMNDIVRAFEKVHSQAKEIRRSLG